MICEIRDLFIYSTFCPENGFGSSLKFWLNVLRMFYFLLNYFWATLFAVRIWKKNKIKIIKSKLYSPSRAFYRVLGLYSFRSLPLSFNLSKMKIQKRKEKASPEDKFTHKEVLVKRSFTMNQSFCLFNSWSLFEFSIWRMKLWPSLMLTLVWPQLAGFAECWVTASSHWPVFLAIPQHVDNYQFCVTLIL